MKEIETDPRLEALFTTPTIHTHHRWAVVAPDGRLIRPNGELARYDHDVAWFNDADSAVAVIRDLQERLARMGVHVTGPFGPHYALVRQTVTTTHEPLEFIALYDPADRNEGIDETEPADPEEDTDR